MYKYLLIFLFFTSASCKKEAFEIDNLNGNKITVLGHAGMGIGSPYPLNSFESVMYAINLGADGCEIDIQMTRDSVLVAFHDQEMGDNTNISGNVYKKTWNEVSEAIYKDPLYSGFRIMNLDMMFTGLADKRSKVFAFDCKNFNPDTSAHYLYTFCNALIKIIDKYNLSENIIIEFKREDLIQTMQTLRPDLRIYIYADFDYGFQVAQKYGLQGLVVPVDKISKAEVTLAHSKGIKVAVFNTHTNGRNIDAIKKNVDIIETDNLKHLLRILD